MPDTLATLVATGEKTNLLGLACEKYEIKQQCEVLEVRATAQLLPFQQYVRGQSRPFGRASLAEQWPELLKAKKLFPLRASLRFQNPVEHYRFEVQSVQPQKPKAEDKKLFEPPTGYFELEPPPF